MNLHYGQKKNKGERQKERNKANFTFLFHHLLVRRETSLVVGTKPISTIGLQTLTAGAPVLSDEDFTALS
jgi:hypothetical protein